MNLKPQPTPLPAKEQIDHIAKYLPDDQRAEYFREMLYCRELPQNDEMLRIVKVLKILTLLMVEIPDKVATQREKLEKLFKEAISSLAEVIRSSRNYQEELDSKIRAIPDAILNGISPSTFATAVSEKLSEQFTTSGLPQTAKELAALAKALKGTTEEFKRAADSLGQTYKGAVSNAKRSTEELETAVMNAAKTAGIEAKRLSTLFHREYRWSLFALTGFALALGLLFGVLLERWRESSSTVAERPAAQELYSEPPITPKHKPKE